MSKSIMGLKILAPTIEQIDEINKTAKVLRERELTGVYSEKLNECFLILLLEKYTKIKNNLMTNKNKENVKSLIEKEINPLYSSLEINYFFKNDSNDVFIICYNCELRNKLIEKYDNIIDYSISSYSGETALESLINETESFNKIDKQLKSQIIYQKIKKEWELLTDDSRDPTERGYSVFILSDEEFFSNFFNSMILKDLNFKEMFKSLDEKTIFKIYEFLFIVKEMDLNTIETPKEWNKKMKEIKLNPKYLEKILKSYKEDIELIPNDLFLSSFVKEDL